MKQNVTNHGFEVFDSKLKSIGWAEHLVAGSWPDAVGLAKRCGGACVVVRCADGVALVAYGDKPGALLKKWAALRGYGLGTLRGAA